MKKQNLAEITGPFSVPDLPTFRPMTHPQLWKAILESKSKRDVIKAFREFGSSHGVFSGCEPEVRQKLDRMVE